MNMPLICGSILGFISVAFGAYAEHGLKKQISLAQFESLMTAVRYNQTHAVIIVSLGLLMLANISGKLAQKVNITALIFTVGTLLFSFSIYASAVFGNKELVSIAPFGGITLMIAWLMLIWCALGYKKQ